MWGFWTRRWTRWMEGRSPPIDQITLTQRNVYILPSRGGLIFAAVTMVLLLAAINEQLNLAYALAFLLGGVGLSAMSTTHSNLRGLTIRLEGGSRVHAGEPLPVTIRLQNTPGKTGRHGLLINESLPCEVAANDIEDVTLSLPTQSRGWVTLPRWRIESTYPLGLFRAWAYWQAASKVLVWPALERQPPDPPGSPTARSEIGSTLPARQDDAQDLRPWRRGDALHDVVWRKSATRLASGLEPISRDAAQHRQTATCWIDWEATAGLSNTEARLSRLAAWLVAAEQAAQHGGPPYGLKMPGMQRDGQAGTAHLHRCLDELAVWGKNTPDPTPPERHG